jgi:hypothetical protein
MQAPVLTPLSFRLLGLALVLAVGVGCPCVREPINASPALRWWLFSNFGAQRVCPEMLKRSAPLKLDPNGNTIGRFFPGTCQLQLNDAAQTVTVQFAGTGYAWTPIAGRISFSANASVEYRMDFYLGDEAVYVWALTNRIVAGPAFQIASVENRVVDWAARTPVGYLANTFGGQIVSGHLASGFTVVRTDSGDEFTLGHIRPPQRPRRPFAVSGDRFVQANETTEIRPEQVDFLGPFEVDGNGQALFVRFQVNGPSVDALVLYRGTADLWRSGLQMGAVLGPPPGAPISQFTIAPGYEQRQKLPLPVGQYYLVVDNSSRVGVTTPPWNPLAAVTATPAVVSYVVELGDASEAF